jgi:hypothetical protein
MTTISFLLLRQIITEILFSFDVILAIILVRYLMYQRNVQEGTRWLFWPHIQGAFALLVLTIGHCFTRLWSIGTFVYMRHGGSIFELEEAFPLALIGTAVAVVGLCWIIRVLTPTSWGERGWMLALALTAAFVGTMRLIT